MNSVSHYNFVNEFIPMPQAMKIPYARMQRQQWKKE